MLITQEIAEVKLFEARYYRKLTNCVIASVTKVL